MRRVVVYFSDQEHAQLMKRVAAKRVRFLSRWIRMELRLTKVLRSRVAPEEHVPRDQDLPGLASVPLERPDVGRVACAVCSHNVQHHKGPFTACLFEDCPCGGFV